MDQFLFDLGLQQPSCGWQQTWHVYYNRTVFLICWKVSANSSSYFFLPSSFLPSFFFFFFHSSRDVFKPIFGLPKKSAYYSRFRLFKHVETLKKKVETPLRTLRVRLNVLTLFVLPILWLFKQIIDIPLFSTCPNLVQLCLS